MKILVYLILLYSVLSSSCNPDVFVPLVEEPVKEDSIKYENVTGSFFLLRIVETTGGVTKVMDMARAEFAAKKYGKVEVGDVYCDGQKLDLGYVNGSKGVIGYPVYYTPGSGFLMPAFLSDTTRWEFSGNAKVSSMTFADPSSFAKLTDPLPDTIISSQGLTISFDNNGHGGIVYFDASDKNSTIYYSRSGGSPISFSATELSALPDSCRICIEFGAPAIKSEGSTFLRQIKFKKQVVIL